MRNPKLTVSLAALAAALCLLPAARGGEAVVLDEANWNLVPGGKEVDAIYGDVLLRNDKAVVVIASALPNRQLNLKIKDSQGSVCDFALTGSTNDPRGSNNDQLTTYHPHAFVGAGPTADVVEIVKAGGAEVVVRATRKAKPKDPVETVTEYTLRDGESALRVVTRRANTGDKPAKVRLTERLFHEKPAATLPPGQHDLLYTYDKYFGMSYGLVRSDGKKLAIPAAAPTAKNAFGLVDYPDQVTPGNGPGGTEIAAGQTLTLDRFLLAGTDAAAVQMEAARVVRATAGSGTAAGAGVSAANGGVTVTVTSDGGKPAARVAVTAFPADKWDATAPASRAKAGASFAFTKVDGSADLPVPAGDYVVVAEQPGCAIGTAKCSVGKGGEAGASSGETGGRAATPIRATTAIALAAPSAVAFDVTDEAGRPSPAKAQFVGVGQTPNPDLGPDQRADGCRNLWFSVKGQFQVPVPPGEYYVLLSRGPEYDAVWRTVKLLPGKTAKVSARLPRVVDSAGWISADFHNHSTISGDNSTQTEGRLAALIAEGVEFAPATEHQRISSYKPYLKAMGAEALMGTSDGMELTNTPLPLAHLNAFPLRVRPNTQFGGGPEVDKDPRVQIQRLRGHDDASEKLVQQNHPDIGWLVYDRDGDGVPDGGFGTLDYTDVIEVWHPTILDGKPITVRAGKKINDRAFNWLQLLNQGRRLPGVANTDAHHCFQESGAIRNWVRSATDDPAAIKEGDVVKASKAGHLVMSSGPFLEASLNGAGPGDDLKLDGGRGQLKVRVQTPNWFGVNRVQVLVNGKADPALNFTRASHPKMFADGVVKFDQTIPVALASDAHVIVVAVEEGGTTGPVMGDGDVPMAISNPIYVDVDGNGFKPNFDTLGAPLPTAMEKEKE